MKNPTHPLIKAARATLVLSVLTAGIGIFTPAFAQTASAQTAFAQPLPAPPAMPEGFEGRGGGPRGFGGPMGGPRGEGRRGKGEGPRGEGRRERGPGGPRGEGRRERRSPVEAAARTQDDLKLFGKLSGDAFNLAGQSRDYFGRSQAATRAGKTEEAQENAKISAMLGRAAIALAEASSGKDLRALRGDDDGPREGRRFAGRPSVPSAEREKNRAAVALNIAHRQLSQDSSGRWDKTARKIYAQANADFKANRFENAAKRARAALMLVRAGN